MTEVETSKPDVSLTGDNTQEKKQVVTEPAGEADKPGSENVQAAIQRAREREEAAKARAEAAEARLKAIEEADKAKKMADMSEADRLRVQLSESEAERGKLKLSTIVSEAMAGKNIPKPVAELIKKTPWAIPAVSEELGDEFTWDEAVTAVRKHLPEYIDSLIVSADKPSEIEPKGVDSERSIDTDAVTRDHVYTYKEVQELAKDPATYEKHRGKILAQMAKSGGKLPQ